MKLYPHIKKNLKAFMKEGKFALICFLMFPMIMAYIYGSMQEDMFQGKSSFEPIRVEFDYDEASSQGAVLSSMLKDESVKKFMAVSSKDPKCKVVISGDFKNISIEKLKGTDNETDMVKGFMEAFSESMNQYKTAIDNVEKLNLAPVQKEELVKKLVGKLSQDSKEPLIEEQLLQGYRTLGAREYYTLSMFSFTSLMLVTMLVKTFYGDRKQGVVRRSFATPSSKENYLQGYLSSCFIMALIVNFTYIVINRILGLAFLDGLPQALLVAVFQSLLQAAVTGVVITFVSNQKMANAIMTVLIFIPCLIGGVFFNADLIELNALKAVSSLSPNMLILNAYKGLSIQQGMSGAMNELVAMAILSVVLLAASLVKVKSGWEE